MRILVTGSAGYLGERICQRLENDGFEVIGFDQDKSRYTTVEGDIQNQDLLLKTLKGVKIVVHIAGYHRPYLHHNIILEQELIDTNIVGTLNVLDSMTKMGIKNLVFTSTTAVYGRARVSTKLPNGTQKATVISEETPPRPYDPYGVSKLAAERLCKIYHERENFNVVILRPSRFFPDQDVNENLGVLNSHNLKANEFLQRRVDIRDLVQAYSLAVKMVENLRFELFLISTSTPLLNCDLSMLVTDAPSVVETYFPHYLTLYRAKKWSMFENIDFIYSTSKAMEFLSYQPQYDFEYHRSKKFRELRIDNQSPPWRQKLS